MVGILAGILLLPCTSTPYLVILSLLSTLENLYEGLILLILYNIVMVIPLLILTLGVYLLSFKTSELKSWSSKNRRVLNSVMGLMIVFLSFYLLSLL